MHINMYMQHVYDVYVCIWTQKHEWYHQSKRIIMISAILLVTRTTSSHGCYAFLSGGGLYAKLCVVEPGTCVGRRKCTPVCKKPMLTGQCSALRTSAAHIDCMDPTSRWIEFPRPTSPIRRIPCLCQGIPRPCCHQRLRWSTRAEDAAPGCFPRHCFSMVLREEFLIFDFNNFVVGGFNPSEKYEFFSWDYIYIWHSQLNGKTKLMFQTTNQYMVIIH